MESGGIRLRWSVRKGKTATLSQGEIIKTVWGVLMTRVSDMISKTDQNIVCISKGFGQDIVVSPLLLLWKALLMAH